MYCTGSCKHWYINRIFVFYSTDVHIIVWQYQLNLSIRTHLNSGHLSKQDTFSLPLSHISTPEIRTPLTFSSVWCPY